MQEPANMPRDVMCHELEMKPGFCECGGFGIGEGYLQASIVYQFHSI